MAKKVDTYLVDDLDGSRPAETVVFGINGAEYEIDLAEHNAREFFDKLDCYIKAGRRLGRRRGRGGHKGRRSQQRHQKLQAARAWLRERGHEIADRGRIPRRLLDEFEAAEAGTV